MKLRLQILISALLIILLNICLADNADEFDENSEGSIIFVSDTQAPLRIEKIYMEMNQNKKATDLIFEQILKKKHAAVFHMGDLVALGYSPLSWKAIDRFVDSLKEEKIPFYPILGNHELMPPSLIGLEQFKARFPEYSITGSLHIINGIAAILLNSNFSHMSQSEIDQQQSWYEKTLQECAIDSKIKAVIVGCHHPPYTDSKNISFDKRVRQDIVPPFIQNKKTILFLSGHSHTFEHFVNGEKNFLIIGGGGGPQHETSENNEDLPKEVTRQKHKIENFFYIESLPSQDHLQLRLQELNTEFSGFHTAYQLDIPFANPIPSPDTIDDQNHFDSN